MHKWCKRLDCHRRNSRSEGNKGGNFRLISYIVSSMCVRSAQAQCLISTFLELFTIVGSVVLFWKRLVRDTIEYISFESCLCLASCRLPCMWVLKRPIRTSLSLLCTYYYFRPNPQWFFSLPPITNSLSWIRTLQNVPRWSNPLLTVNRVPFTRWSYICTRHLHWLYSHRRPWPADTIVQCLGKCPEKGTRPTIVFL